jgi:hypothetical protein
LLVHEPIAAANTATVTTTDERNLRVPAGERHPADNRDLVIRRISRARS